MKASLRNHILRRNELIKRAVDVQVGSPAIGTLARIVSYFFPRAYVLPEAYQPITSEKDPHFQKAVKLLNRLARAASPAEKEALKNLVVYTSGPDFINDLIFLRDPTKSFWERIGGRIWHTPWSPLHKFFATLIYPFSVPLSIISGPYYNKFTHSIILAGRDPAVLTHELGHALDYGRELYRTDQSTLVKWLRQFTPAFYRQAFYSPYLSEGKVPLLPVRGMMASTLRYLQDLPILSVLVAYGTRRYLRGEPLPGAWRWVVPLTAVAQELGRVQGEVMANRLSNQLLAEAARKRLLSSKEFEDIIRHRTVVLPTAFQSYVARLGITPLIYTKPQLFESSFKTKLLTTGTLTGAMGLGRAGGTFVSGRMTKEDIHQGLAQAVKEYANLRKFLEGEERK